MTLRTVGIAVGMLVLAGCAENYTGAPVTEDIFVANPGGAPGAPLDATGAGAVTTTPLETPPTGGVDPALAMVEEQPGGAGLVEREPDTCRMSDYLYLQGQTATAVQGAGITRAYRVVGPNDIVTQEYNPMRVNFYTDSGGTIGRVSCG